MNRVSFISLTGKNQTQEMQDLKLFRRSLPKIPEYDQLSWGKLSQVEKSLDQVSMTSIKASSKLGNELP